MDWLMILIEAVVFLGLFTAMVMIPTIRNPVLEVHNYPPEIQEEYFKTHPRIETAPLRNRTILIKSAGIMVFAVVLAAGAVLGGAYKSLDDPRHGRPQALYPRENADCKMGDYHHRQSAHCRRAGRNHVVVFLIVADKESSRRYCQ